MKREDRIRLLKKTNKIFHICFGTLFVFHAIGVPVLCLTNAISAGFAGLLCRINLLAGMVCVVATLGTMLYIVTRKE